MEIKNNEKKILEIDIDDILPNRFQPRIKFNEKALLELSESIKEHGVLQPIILRPIGDKYEIIVGERRYKASVLAGKQTIPAIISDLNDKDSAEVALIENVQRENLTPIEEAVSYKKILEMSYLTQNELAEKLDKKQSTIANKLRLLNLEIEVQEALLDEKISERHARSLLRIEDRDDQVEMMNKIIEDRLTVRQTDKAIDEMLENNEIEKKEEEIVDSEKEFNIPTSPIIEEVVEDQVDNIKSDIDDLTDIRLPLNDDIPLNPGFMDISKIENEASDIYIEKPVADLDNLLKPEIAPKAEIIPEESVSEDDNFQINSNRFFNFGNLDDDSDNDEDNEGSNIEISYPQINEEITTPIDNFEFNNYFTPTTNEETMNNEENNNDADDITPATTPITEEIVPQIDNFEFNNYFNPIEEEPKNIPEEEIIDIDDFDNLEETTSNDNSSFILEEKFNNNESTLVESSKEEPIEPVQNSYTNPNDLRLAINTVRRCSKELENLGYVIDVEELDFENTYQVIFKISK